MEPNLYLNPVGLMPQKYIIAIIGDVDAGKTTTISKIYEKLDKNGKISSPVHIWGMPNITKPRLDFSLFGTTKYGLTGILSRGDQIGVLKSDLNDLANKDCKLIICACRKEYPDTFNAVAKISWQHGYTIIWINLCCPPGITHDDYTDSVSTQIANIF